MEKLQAKWSAPFAIKSVFRRAEKIKYYTELQTSDTQNELRILFVLVTQQVKLVSLLPQAQKRLCYSMVVVSHLAAVPIVYVGKANVT